VEIEPEEQESREDVMTNLGPAHVWHPYSYPPVRSNGVLPTIEMGRIGPTVWIVSEFGNHTFC
jgi:hypothetical protein